MLTLIFCFTLYIYAYLCKTTIYLWCHFVPNPNVSVVLMWISHVGQNLGFQYLGKNMSTYIAWT